MSDVHGAIMRICDDVRGSVDSFDFKNFVFTALFYRFLCEVSHIVPDGSLLADLLEQQEGISERFAEVLRGIETEHPEFSGLFDGFYGADNRLGCDDASRDACIYKLLSGIASMPLDGDEIVDPFGDAYEFMMQMYAANGGRSGGEYFTPKEVSELVMRLATVGRDNVRSVYDPTCGSGSLLLRSREISPNVVLNGQELNPSTYNLARMNMVIHGVSDYDIRRGDTLTNPLHDGVFDTIVSNPPYSVKWIGKDDKGLESDPRFAPAGVLAPKSKADWAFLQHIVSRLADAGTAAVVVFPGILYRSGAEQKIRKWFVENNLIDAVIGLPANLFFGTSITTNIVILKKNRAVDAPIKFVDASNQFKKTGKQNQLTPENIEAIVGLYVGDDVAYTSCSVSRDAVADADYSLSLANYVESKPAAPRRPLPEIMLDLAVSRRKTVKGYMKEYEFFMKKEIVSFYFVEDLMRLVFTDRITAEEIRDRLKSGYYDGLSVGEYPVTPACEEE